MIEKIKKLQGICNSDFDDIILGYIESCKIDLKSIGVSLKKINSSDNLIDTAILTYVLSFLDINNAEMYANSYSLQKDVLRHLTEYKEA